MTSDVPPKSYGLVREHMHDIESFTYRARVGDVVIFNSRNPHEVSPGAPAGEGRLQVGSFVGRMPNDALVLFA